MRLILLAIIGLALAGCVVEPIHPNDFSYQPELRVSYGIEAVIGFGGRGLI
jgi:hypothetical protein